MADPVIETWKVERIVDTYANTLDKMTVPQISFISDAVVSPQLSEGTPITREDTTFHALAAQYDIDATTKVATRANNIFGELDITSAKTKYIDVNTTEYQTTPPANVKGRLYYDKRGTISCMTGDEDFQLRLGRMTANRVINGSGGAITKGMPIYPYTVDITTGNVKVKKASCLQYEANYVVGIAGTDSLDGEELEFVMFGLVENIDTSGLIFGQTVWLGATPGTLVSTPPSYPCRHVLIGGVTAVDATAGAIEVVITIVDYDDSFESSFVQKLDIDVVVTGGVAGLEIEASGGGDFNLQMNGVFWATDATTGGGVGGKARVALTSGTSTVPAKNFIYEEISGGTNVLTSSTTRPTSNYGMIAEVSLLDTVTTDTYGPLMIRLWTNAKVNGPGNDIGLTVALAERLRLEGSKYDSGVDTTITIDTVASPDTISVTATAGIVFQMWRQAFEAYDIATDGIWVANASGTGTLTKYQRITNLGLCRELADGTAIAKNERYSLVIFACINSSGYAKWFVNLPTGVNSIDENGYNDISNYAVVSVPSELKSTAFLVERIPLKYTTTGGENFTFINGVGQTETISLLGNPVGLSGSSGSSSIQNEYSDTLFKIYDNTDATAIARFDCTGITTATTRTLSVLDVSGDVTTGVSVPATAGATGVTGSIAYDGSYLYVCTSTDTWLRTAIITW